jgi:hypothetical protein
MTGKPYLGHFSIWITNEIQKHRLALGDQLVGRPSNLDSWVNTDFYQPTKEVIGVLPIPLDVQRTNGLSEYIKNVETPTGVAKPPKRPSARHDYLAMLQGTKKAVLPVHTPAEHKLFSTLMSTDLHFLTPSGVPNWEMGVKVWNRKANVTDGIYYKVRKSAPEVMIDYMAEYRILAYRAVKVALHKLEGKYQREDDSFNVSSPTWPCDCCTRPSRPIRQGTSHSTSAASNPHRSARLPKP